MAHIIDLEKVKVSPDNFLGKSMIAQAYAALGKQSSGAKQAAYLSLNMLRPRIMRGDNRLGLIEQMAFTLALYNHDKITPQEVASMDGKQTDMLIEALFAKFTADEPSFRLHYLEGVLGLSFSNKSVAIAVLNQKPKRGATFIYAGEGRVYRGWEQGSNILHHYSGLVLPENADKMKRHLDSLL